MTFGIDETNTFWPKPAIDPAENPKAAPPAPPATIPAPKPLPPVEPAIDATDGARREHARRSIGERRENAARTAADLRRSLESSLPAEDRLPTPEQARRNLEAKARAAQNEARGFELAPAKQPPNQSCTDGHPKKPQSFEMPVFVNDAEVSRQLGAELDRAAKKLPDSERAALADRYAERLAERDRFRGSDFGDRVRLGEAARLRDAAAKSGKPELSALADDLVARPIKPEERAAIDALMRTKPQDLSLADVKAGVAIADRLRPADHASYDARTNIRKVDEALFLKDAEVKKLFDANEWMDPLVLEHPASRAPAPRAFDNNCLKPPPTKVTAFDFSERGQATRGRRDQPKIYTAGEAAELKLTTTDARFKGSRQSWSAETSQSFATERERLIRENDQRARIEASPDDPLARLRSGPLTPAQEKKVADHARNYEIRKLDEKVRPAYRQLDEEYRRNQWSPDSPWYGVDDAAFLQELASKDDSKISRYDAMRGLHTAEKYRHQYPEIFAERDAGFASARDSDIYFRDVAQMKAAGAADLAARERAIEADPDNPIAYLKRPIAELGDADRDVVTKDYTKYGVERVERKLRSQAVANVGREVERLDKHFDRMLKEQGVIGDTANWLKNNVGSDGGWIIDSKLGSNAVIKTIGEAHHARRQLAELASFQGTPAEFRKVYSERLDALKSKLEGVQGHMRSFKESQDDWVEGISDVGSTVAAIGAAALAPATGGASLLVGLAVGAGTKVGLKSVDAFTGGDEYKGNVLVDLATGGINGVSGVGSGLASKKVSSYLLKRASVGLAEGETLPMLMRAGAFLGTRTTVGAVDGFASQTATGLIRGDADPLGRGLRGAALGAVMFPLADGVTSGLGSLWKAARPAAGLADDALHHANYLARAPDVARDQIKMLTAAELRGLYPEGGAIPMSLDRAARLPGFVELARSNPAQARVLADACSLFPETEALCQNVMSATIRDARNKAGGILAPDVEAALRIRALDDAATAHQPMLPVARPLPTDPRYMLVQRGARSPDSVPEVTLRPTLALDHNGAFHQQARIPGKGALDEYAPTRVAAPTPMQPWQLVVGGQRLSSMDGVMVFSGHGARDSFEGVKTSEAATMIADQVAALRAQGRPLNHVVLDSCHQRDARWFLGGSNAEALEEGINGQLVKKGLQPIQVLAADRGGALYGNAQRSYLKYGIDDAGGLRTNYKYEFATYTPAADGAKFYMTPEEAAITALGVAAPVAGAGGGYYLYRTLDDHRKAKLRRTGTDR